MPGAAFLLSQVGFHSSRLWSERMAALGLDPRHVLLLRLVAAEEGRSQQALGEQMRLPPSRMVSFVDELEDRGLLQRRPVPGDRRVRALYLTTAARKTLGEVMKVSAEHEKQMCAGLKRAEREELIALLNRIVARQGLAPGVHPGVAERGPRS
ncbi:MAG TPA: MarR family winged helix-turn-helix transcriptional regulator [Actinomycetota bacterium]|nr:MarR family winged helix-turn-helix transcriptional regulator [Actinomycetota bacterium]